MCFSGDHFNFQWWQNRSGSGNRRGSVVLHYRLSYWQASPWLAVNLGRSRVVLHGNCRRCHCRTILLRDGFRLALVRKPEITILIQNRHESYYQQNQSSQHQPLLFRRVRFRTVVRRAAIIRN